MTNMGKCACDMYTSSLFYGKRKYSFIDKTKNTEKC